jgi:methionyl-tRNA formyltransferase
MRIVIIGNQKFGAAVLQKFYNETDHDVVAILCKKDFIGKPIDPIKKLAEQFKIPVFQPENYKDKKLLNKIKKLKPDICVMAYVTSLIPKEFREIFVKGSVCFHPSLLPKHRGPSAINWPIILGSKETGLTIFYPNDFLDQGDIIIQKKVRILKNDTMGDVYFSKIFPLGVNACVEAVDLIDSNNAHRIVQNEKKATYESWCKKPNAKIEWNKSGKEIYNLIRGCNPQPGAWANIESNQYSFYDTSFELNKNSKFLPGEIISIKKHEIVISVIGGVLKVSRIKSTQGKLYIKEMDTSVFHVGEVFT